MAVLVVLALAMALAYYVTLPLRGRVVEERAPAASLRGELYARKRAALGAILDIESERDAGKLSNQDFAALRAEYEAEAIDALRDLERADGADPRMDLPEPDDELEAEIAALRAELICPRCGAPRPRGSLCPRCGAA
jgi:hypothetical protein